MTSSPIHRLSRSLNCKAVAWYHSLPKASQSVDWHQLIGQRIERCWQDGTSQMSTIYVFLASTKVTLVIVLIYRKTNLKRQQKVGISMQREYASSKALTSIFARYWRLLKEVIDHQLSYPYTVHHTFIHYMEPNRKNHWHNLLLQSSQPSMRCSCYAFPRNWRFPSLA